ncbi:MAG: IS1595 family transposase [Bacteroidota bacterium]|nr:IS1595 family transposase [Bacteroidota bacterium]
MFKNLIEATQYFSDKQTCIDYLTKMRWNGNVTCAHCNHNKVYELKGANKRYKCAKCRKQFSAIKGTIFENSPISLQKWFIAMYILYSHKKGISSCQLAKDLGVTQKTAWFMGQRIRFAAQTKNFAKPVMSTVVECDETYVGGKEKNKHKSKRIEGSQGRSGKGKTAVFGLLERNGVVVAMKVTNTQKDTLQPLIEQYVSEGSTIMTDEWLAYKGLQKKFKHGVVNHGAGIYVIDINHTNTIEGFWSLLKRGIIGIYHQVSPKHLDRYVDEFEYRYNNRKLSESTRFENLLSLASKRLTYKNLTINA